MIKKVAVLGSGAVAQALSADLTLKGLEVHLCNSRVSEKFKPLLERKEIDLVDSRKNIDGVRTTVKLNKVTTDFADAMKGVDYIILTTTAEAHRLYFTSMIPHLEDRQTVVICPGNFGSLLLANMLKEKGVKKDITIVETMTTPAPSRLLGPCNVWIQLDCIKFWYAAFPANNTKRVSADMKSIYPYGEPADNVLAVSMSNGNPIVHPVGSIMNAGWVDTLRKDFYLYRLGITLSVARAVKAIYDEITKIADALGTKAFPYPEDTFWTRGTLWTSIYVGPFDSYGVVYANTSGPSSMKSRYITEDVPYGLVPIALLARKLNVPTPAIDSVINLALVVNQTDYWKQGRTLEEMGIAGLTRDELLKVLETGF